MKLKLALTVGGYMLNCSKCSSNLPKARHELGYTICVKCSVEEKKVGHVIYPHKTGAFVQVVSKSTQENLNKLDRRGYRTSGAFRNYKDIIVDVKNKDLDKGAKSSGYRSSHINNNFIKFNKALQMVKSYYHEWGYERALDYLRELNSGGKIPLTDRCKLQDVVNDMYLSS